jgi:glycosyltransferase involved in cell wall biosynthesis
MSKGIDITVVVSTYNRSEMLGGALDSVLRQESRGVSYEVIVADNNSTDGTREVVESYKTEWGERLRYVFEPRQGVSYARNAGIAEARGEIIAFADDDVRVSKDWVARIKAAFDEHPEIDCVGGKVLPHWNSEPPRWLTRDHWMPLALLDYGEEPVSINAGNPLCLVSANLAFRREALLDAGLFAPDLQRVKDGIGSMEDSELLERFWRTGRQCLYVPDLIVTTDVPGERMTKDYHRRWHSGHGYFFAIMRSEAMERSSVRLFDVPAHLYKQAIADSAAWLKCLLSGKRDRAFTHEIGMRFFLGFYRKRRRDYLSGAQRGTLREIFAFVRSLISKKDYRAMPKEIG